MSTTEAIFVTATKDQAINDAFWTAAVSSITESQKTALTSRLKAMQLMIGSRYVTAVRLTSNVTLDGQVFVLVVTR